MRENHYCPNGYVSELSLRDTQQAIKALKDCFQQQLASALNLTRVSAPLFVRKKTGLNDDLNGTERKVSFDMLEAPEDEIQVVQSLAKWKRDALGRYGYPVGSGLYTDMNAIRRDEVTDNLHSIYVDQWDWEKVLTARDRTVETLKDAVERIHSAVLEAETVLHSRYPALQPRLPAKMTFVTSEELYALYSDRAPEEREELFVREHKAVFVIGIGGALPDGRPHGTRAPDYDDWTLNGDLLYYHRELDRSMEISSMGIRVDACGMFSQLEKASAMQRLELPFHQKIMRGELPLTIGGGIGQSRLCMLLLRKAHIGEVQCSVWPEGIPEKLAQNGITLL
ncbi:MAG: aspartate--ammonia ligase [Christensenellales bacterium]|jgi:aspartate--ammonia ligase